MKRLAAIVLSILLAQHASAQCSCTSTNFNCSISSMDTVCITPTYDSGTDKWTIVVSATADSGNNVITVTIEANTDETKIASVQLSNTAGAGVELRVTLKGTGVSTNLESVDSITESGGSTGIVTLTLLETEASIGTVSVDRLTLATIRGNLTGNVTVSNGNLGTLQVDGSIAGGVTISAPAGRIEVINVPTAGADIGASGNLATISCRDELRSLFVADDVWANVTVLNSSTYGPVGRLEVGGSIVAGAWRFDRFDTFTGITDPGLFLDGDLGATLTTESAVDEPITIGGDATAAITIGGSILAHFTIEGTPTAPIAVEGSLGVNGGTPVAADFRLGTASVATPITADITFTGSINRGDVDIFQPYDAEFLITGSVVTNALTNTHRFQFQDDFTSGALLDIGGNLSVDSQLQFFGTTAGRINIRGDSSGLVRFLDEFLSTAALHIGDSLTALSGENGGIILFEETDHLIGQVVINSLNPGTPGQWIGDVRLSLFSPIITLRPGAASPNTAPHYQRLSSTIGGGAVGLAPFALHYQDCSPAHNAVVYPDFYTVVLRFYGPITSNGDLPVDISWRPAGSTGSWTLDNENWSVVSGYGTRRLELMYFDNITDPSFVPELREYKIVPAT